MDALCKSCNAELSGPYCSNCGQYVIAKRLEIRSLLSLTVKKVFDLENSFWTTTKLLITDPAQVVYGYLGGATKRYYNPIRYTFISIAIVVIVMNFFGMSDASFTEINKERGVTLSNDQQQLQDAIYGWMMRFMNFISFLVIPFYALLSAGLYRKKKLNYAEHLAIHCYGLGIAGFIGLPFTFTAGVMDNLMVLGTVFSLSISFLYYLYYYQKLWPSSYVVSSIKSFATVIGGLILFYIAFLLLSILIFGRVYMIHAF